MMNWRQFWLMNRLAIGSLNWIVVRSVMNRKRERRSNLLERTRSNSPNLMILWIWMNCRDLMVASVVPGLMWRCLILTMKVHGSLFHWAQYRNLVSLVVLWYGISLVLILVMIRKIKKMLIIVIATTIIIIVIVWFNPTHTQRRLVRALIMSCSRRWMLAWRHLRMVWVHLSTDPAVRISLLRRLPGWIIAMKAKTRMYMLNMPWWPSNHPSHIVILQRQRARLMLVITQLVKTKIISSSRSSSSSSRRGKRRRSRRQFCSLAIVVTRKVLINLTRL